MNSTEGVFIAVSISMMLLVALTAVALRAYARIASIILDPIGAWLARSSPDRAYVEVNKFMANYLLFGVVTSVIVGAPAFGIYKLLELVGILAI